MLSALALGLVIGLVNHAGVIAGMVDPPPGCRPLYYVGNLDVPQYLTWIELGKTYWLLPNYHAPWRTEPALFQPMFTLLGRSGLPTMVAYYGLQIALYVLAAYALILAAETFLRTRRAMLYGALATISALPLLLVAWTFSKAFGLAQSIQALLAYGIIQYGYDSADGFLRGGLSNSPTLTFGTAMILFAFTNLARYVTGRQRKHYFWLLACVLLNAFFHPFEIFIIAAAAIWPLWRIGRKTDCLGLFCAAAAGMLPYLIQAGRTEWIRDILQRSEWAMASQSFGWAMLVFGLPAMIVCWLMLIRFRPDRPEDGVLQAWFLAALLLPMIPGTPAGVHGFDGFAYCTGFLLVRKAQTNELFSRLFRERPRRTRAALLAWGALSCFILTEVYVQVWKDGRSVAPQVLLSSVVPQQQAAIVDWMRSNLPHDGLVLAPDRMAPWIAAIPMPSFASHDVFGITYSAQRDLAQRFYKGEQVWHELVEAFGVRYVVAPSGAPIAFGDCRLLHRESGFEVYEVPGAGMKPYPGGEHLAGVPHKKGLAGVLRAVTALFSRTA